MPRRLGRPRACSTVSTAAPSLRLCPYASLAGGPDAYFGPSARANTMRCGSGDAYRSLARRSAESFLLSPIGAAAAEPPTAAASSTPPLAARKARRERGSVAMPLSCRSETVMSDRVGFECNGAPVEIGVAPGESLLSVLRERLGIVSAKD